MFENFTFPNTPTFIAKWKPIYFEPVVNSGERITILILVQHNNDIKYFHALHDNVVENLYGSKANSFKNLVNFIKDQLTQNNGELNNCIEGVFEGHWHHASSSDVFGIAKQALIKTASLGTLAIEELFVDDLHSENDSIDQNWSSKIKSEFIKEFPKYEKSFNHSVNIKNNVKIKCGFYSSEYIAKFNVCTTQTIHRMKSSLMDLNILNKNKISNNFDLLIHLPPVDNIHISQKMHLKMNDNILILKDQCKDTNIQIIVCDNEKDGVKRIAKMLKVA